MKTYVKLQAQVKQYKQHSPKFATASVQVGEKDKNGQWHNYWVSLRIFNPEQPLLENVDYTITGSLGVSPAYNQYPEKMAINVKTVQPTQTVQASQATQAPTAPQEAPSQAQHVQTDNYSDAFPKADQEIPF